MELKPLKVSELNQYIKRIIISDPILYNISVEGEISNFKHHHNGHMYFTIKDEKSKVKCIMFSEDNNILDFVPKDGMNVYITGYVSVYDREGSYQLYIKKMRKKGLGELYEAFQKLKLSLEKQGLFKEDDKKTIPYMPRKIGIVTSSTGAAVRDIITTIKRRMRTIDILVYQVMVQGEKAHIDICKGIRYFNTRDDIDVLIIGRGGGSIEELWAFNEESIAREIYASKIPVISAVGHETDFTIADFVADIRASTPSVAAEIATPSVDSIKYKMDSLLNNLIMNYSKIVESKRKDIELLKKEIIINSPVYETKESEIILKVLRKNLIEKMIMKINLEKNNLQEKSNKLSALSPLSVLNRGYNIAMDEKNKTVKSINDIKQGENLQLIFQDGNANVKIISIESKVNNYE